jgi:uncharacterized protein DUF6602
MRGSTIQGSLRLNQVDLKEVFTGLQNEMVAKLSSARLNIPHTGTLGDVGETSWLQMFQRYLPQRYQAESAMVVDCHGLCSQQIDVVIFDRHYSPFLLTLDDAKFVPAESVYAVFEVKQEMQGYIQYAGEKAASVRVLQRTSADIVNCGNVQAGRPCFRILAGLLALESGWNPPFGTPFADALNALTVDAQLDIGCCLNGGSFECEWTNDKPQLRTSSSTTALIYFFLRLLARLQAFGTAPAMDLGCYAKQLA